MNMKNLIAAFCIAGISLGSAATIAEAAGKQPAAPSSAAPAKDKEYKKDAKKEAKADKKAGVVVGDKAPSFSLTSYDGKDIKLDELLKTNKAVVVQWFNPECPYVAMHYQNGVSTFNDLQKQYASKGIALVGINSGGTGNQGAATDTNKKAISDWKIEYPICPDLSGEVGRSFGAKNTPAMYIITADGKIAYSGAIDNNQGRDKKDAEVKHYVKAAIDEILAGKPVTTPTTAAYGCGVKYAKAK